MIYIGIDLGTTNSAIATYDGTDVTLYKSPEQRDVTPSVIFVDRRGNRYVGARAYNNAALDPDNAALLFKRQMGTNTQFNLPNLDKSLSAEACSAELLKVLFGYLPESLQESDLTGTVITVPAAFDQMQKDATLAAAELAGIGRVALMQEPVAAVMSVMRKRRADGVFLIYDLGGGTLDIAVAQSIGGTVSLLAHGGIVMCGGRDFDRMLVDSVVQPWLHKTFDLSKPYSAAEQKRLYRLAAWASEKAKIELSRRDTTSISLSEAELNRHDSAGVDMYLDVPLDRSIFNHLIEEQLETSIEAARRTLDKAGLEAADVERVVFVGGPTFYPHLRERVAAGLGIAASTEVNPMTAVAEGAAVFAESIEWSSASRARKSSSGQLRSAPLAVTFHFASRTPNETVRVSVELGNEAPPGAEFQIDCQDTGWSSGRRPLRKGATMDLPLTRAGDNAFRGQLFDAAGRPLLLDQDRIVITRTAAAVEGIPASRSIAIEVNERVDGPPTLDYLVREGDLLPKRDARLYKAATALQPGEARSLNFKIWEGEIREPIKDNRFVGVFSIRGSDLEDRAIPVGADIICEYEISDSGTIVLHVRVPAVSSSFDSGRNFYSRQEGQIDFENAESFLRGEASDVARRLEQLSGRVPDEELEPAKRRVTRAETNVGTGDPERAKAASEDLQEAKRLLSQARTRNMGAIREIELEHVSAFFNETLRALARPGEIEAFDAAARAAEAAIERHDGRFEELIDYMRGRSFTVLWRQDWFITGRLQHFSESPHLFRDQPQFRHLIALGEKALGRNDMDGVRKAVLALEDIRVGVIDDAEIALVANIIKVR